MGGKSIKRKVYAGDKELIRGDVLGRKEEGQDDKKIILWEGRGKRKDL